MLSPGFCSALPKQSSELASRMLPALTCATGGATPKTYFALRSEEHTSELQSRLHLVCRLLLEKKKYCEQLLPFRQHHDRARDHLVRHSQHVVDVALHDETDPHHMPRNLDSTRDRSPRMLDELY